MRLLIPFAFASALLASNIAIAQSTDQHHGTPSLQDLNRPMSISPSFDVLLAQAMDRMHSAMAVVTPSGQPDRDFLATMVPHHQGAIDMAKAIVLVTTDPRIRNLSQSIITEQQYEIELMNSLLSDPSITSSAREKAQ